MKKYLNVKTIPAIAILGALGAILMFFDFPIAFAPPFYKVDLGDLPCLIGGFALGSIPALFIQLIKIIVKLIIKPTSTAFVGEIAAFIFSSAYCVSASYIYQLQKNKKGAIKAMIIGSLVMVVVAVIANYFFIIPAYVKLYKMPLEAIISMGTKIFPFINNKLSFVLSCVVIFNVVKAVIVDALTLVLYKHVSPIIKCFSK